MHVKNCNIKWSHLRLSNVHLRVAIGRFYQLFKETFWWHCKRYLSIRIARLYIWKMSKINEAISYPYGKIAIYSFLFQYCKWDTFIIASEIGKRSQMFTISHHNESDFENLSPSKQTRIFWIEKSKISVNHLKQAEKF